MAKSLTYTLSIAGFDPCGGAGILADIKTFEHFKCMGMAIQTANTIQTENQFISVNWINEDLVLHQLETLLKQYRFKTIKIGLIQSISTLKKVIDICLKYNPNVKIIWDTVLSASAGFDFNFSANGIYDVLQKLYLITPNFNEINQLTNLKNSIDSAKQLSKHTKVILKGGHNNQNKGKDYLFETINGQLIQKSYNPKTTVKPINEKHGSGCVFSSALAANLAQGYPLHKSILKSKRYIEHYLSSNKTLLGQHKL